MPAPKFVVIAAATGASGGSALRFEFCLHGASAAGPFAPIPQFPPVEPIPSLLRTTLPDFAPAPPVTGLGDAGVSPASSRQKRQHDARAAPAHRGLDAR